MAEPVRARTPLPEGRRVPLGVIAGAHGVRGAVRIRSFTENPTAIGGYGALYDGRGRALRLTIQGAGRKGEVIARVDGIADRDAAEALKGVELSVPRQALPATASDEFYLNDLIGLAAVAADGQALGRVVALHNWGGGDVIEIRDASGAERLLPFSKSVVPVIDLAAGRLVVNLPTETEVEG
ncbi:MAG: ribosome maturation factor RimM, partial [Alphaproteobacteria bacterium]|nr:ribosome maturation factor RimM [Alphaproteobacteria bacterium]